MAVDLTSTKDVNALSEWFVGALSADPLPLDHLLGVLDALQRDGRRKLCREWAEMLREAVTERGDASGLVRVLNIGARAAEDLVSFRLACRPWLSILFTDRRHAAFLESVGFDTNLSPIESLRRLGVLMGLKDGAFCMDKTWGFGVVQRVDDFYKKVTIDFSRKPGHVMTFAYAAESLQLVGPDHLLARKHTKPAELAALARENAGEIVHVALASYGPLTVVQLQELIGQEGIDGGDWKGFWDRARKALKSDPLVEVPTRRSEPLRLLQARKAYDADWFAALQKERDAKTILERAVELEKSGEAEGLDPEFRKALAERVAFGVMGAEDRHPELAARLVLTAERMNLANAGFDLASAAQKLTERDRLLGCMNLPAREVDSLLRLLEQHLSDAGDRLARLVPRLPIHAARVVIDSLRAAGRSDAVAQMAREGLLSRTVSTEVMDYLCEHRELLSEWQLGSLSDLLLQVIVALEATVSGERYRTQKALRERFEDRAWLEPVLAALDARERSQLLGRIRQSRGWEETARRSLMGRIIKLYPDLETVVARVDRKPEEKKDARFSSWRSYRERQKQLRELVEIKIPENSKAIAHARGYGDLRENFEYQAAKDEQRLLMRRQGELEQDLGEVKGTDFAGMPTQVAGMGVGVSLQHANGEVHIYWVLGEWDRDEILNIISNKSELAKRLEGATAGTEITLPGDPEGQMSRVLAILPLTDEIKAWVRATA
ncbi:MAG: hypothetical protein K8T26_16890 [Lentisphaerae bacterium]|nr:hypothetical protein [Lentisphaerota bacterium]